MRRLTVMAACLLLISVISSACGTGATPDAPAGEPEPTSPAAPIREVSMTDLVGRWIIVEYGVELEFAADGRLTKYVMADEHQVEYWTVDGSFRLVRDGWIVIQWANEQPAEFEYRLEGRWLTLRAPDGRVSRYLRIS